ncbi:unnamed protein product [Bemisia tabaci]|uniref:Transmembrane protein 208 n=1 Tax=Bemisia tabaci TaxID=7038 RepID=A0A9P0AH37_BEMTA|nr:PREDICTED: transmembrane protein 208 [Bemisia tabaci]CAH0391692.1 unnamed protein product [Bemisia tabaci]
MAPQKGKQATKGAKLIVSENSLTLEFYKRMILGANAVFLVGTYFLSNLFSFWSIVLLLLANAAYLGSYKFMEKMAHPTYSDSGQLIDSGVDLNMEGGLAEHVKDLIILTAGCQGLSVISRYFWMLWILAPARALWMLWTKFLGPWFFQQPSPAEEEQDLKKKKKLERKMKRIH